MKYAKTALEIAAERYRIDPQRFGLSKLYDFVFVTAIATGEQSSPVNVTVRNDSIMLGLRGNPSDGAVAGYAGLALQFTYGGEDFCTDGQTASFASFASLFGNQSHPEYEFDIPVLVKGGTTLTAIVRNRTGADANPPNVYARLVELRG